MIGLVFDVGDTVLAYQGLPTASSFDYVFSPTSDLNAPLFGHSLGSVDVNNLASFGAPASSITSAALPMGKAGGVGVRVLIGTGDPINLGKLGKGLTPSAIEVPQGDSWEMSNHSIENYWNFYIQ